MAKLYAVAQFETTLASGISISATTATLSSNITGDKDSAVLPSGDYGFVIDESNVYREYVIATVSGTGLTFVKRGLSYIDGDTAKAGNKFAHRKGASIKIVSYPVITRMLSQVNGDVNLDGVPKLPSTRTINNSRHITDKEYVDNILASGISALAVTDNGGITININSGYYSLNGTITYYAGAAAEALTDDATNYVELVDGSLSINTTAFSDDAMPLAKVITVSGDITSLTDARAILGWLDIKASSGIGRDTNGIFVDLATTPGLEFDSGKLRAKIKASGGLVRDADGLSVDMGTTANKIVQLDSSAKIPAVDGSQLTNLPSNPFTQLTPYIASASTSLLASNFTSEADGSVLYLVYANSGSLFVQRYAKDTSGLYYKTHSADFALSSTDFGLCVIGSYLYITAIASGTKYIKRYNKADLTNLTSITISGSQFGNTICWSNGTDLFVHNTTNTAYKYTISGTTATFSSEITYTSSDNYKGCIGDGTNVWIMTDSSGDLTIRKYLHAGGAVVSTKTIHIPYSAYPNGQIPKLILLKTGYLGVVVVFSSGDSSTQSGCLFQINPITAN